MEEIQIDIDFEASPLSLSMQRNKLWGKTNDTETFTIFRTPHDISQTKKNLFEPCVISIGPFHRDQKHLRALEEQKWWFLQDFLSRGDHISLDLCISEMKLLEERTRRCYNESVDLKSNAFVEMMLLDGCFVLEFFLQVSEGYSNSIPDIGWNFNFVYFDLILLENQIPFFIVEKLYEIGLKQGDRNNFVTELILNLALLLTNGSTDSIKLGPLPDKIHHLVHLCYHCLVPIPEKPVVSSSKSGLFKRIFHHSTSQNLLNSTENISSMVIPSATELKQKGLKFIPKDNPKHMLDISFELGVLKIPKLAIADCTKPIFTNLIAFEQSKYGQEDRPFASFLVFLNNLVNTQNDATILQQKKIIENWLGSEEELTQFINQVTEGSGIPADHYLAGLYREVNRYSNSRWNRHRAKLIRDYFSSPWAAISLVAALILLVLTCIQSFYAIYAYYIPLSS